MKVGTRSVLFGAHCFFIHPWFVALAWWRLYGFPWDPRLWVAFFVHDLGYLGKPNMDGEEGETHPELGSKIMSIFDLRKTPGPAPVLIELSPGKTTHVWAEVTYQRQRLLDRLGAESWHDFSLLHSRFYAKKHRRQPSRLCAADKLATCITPRWLYLILVNLTGEVKEYLALHNAARGGEGKGKYAEDHANLECKTGSQREWHRRMTTHMRQWAYDNR